MTNAICKHGFVKEPWGHGCLACNQESGNALLAVYAHKFATKPTDTERLDWWFAHGINDSVCEGSVDLWWATEVDGHAATVVTHGTSVRDAIDRAMRGIFERESKATRAASSSPSAQTETGR